MGYLLYRAAAARLAKRRPHTLGKNRAGGRPGPLLDKACGRYVYKMKFKLPAAERRGPNTKNNPPRRYLSYLSGRVSVLKKAAVFML